MHPPIHLRAKLSHIHRAQNAHGLLSSWWNPCEKVTKSSLYSLGARNNPCARMGQSGSPLLSFACPQRLPYRTNISDEATTALSRFRKATPTRGAADYGRRCVCQAAKLLSNAAGSDGSRLQGTKNAPQSALGLENSGCACAEGCSRA